MSLKTKVILQTITSLILTIVLANLSFGIVSKLGSKNSLYGVFKINMIDNDIFFDNSLMPKIALFAYEEKERITKDAVKGTVCYEMQKDNKTIIELEEDKFTKYFQMQITSNARADILEDCFNEFLAVVEKRYQNMITKIERNFVVNYITDTKINQIFKENYDQLDDKKSTNFDQLALLEKYKVLLDKDMKLITFNNHLKSLQTNKPFDVIRVNLSQQTFSKNTYNIILFIIIFFLMFSILNRKLFQIESVLEKLKKTTGLN